MFPSTQCAHASANLLSPANLPECFQKIAVTLQNDALEIKAFLTPKIRLIVT
jgi:hypothetical protein